MASPDELPEFPIVQHSFIFDFCKDNYLVTLDKTNITGIHPLKKLIVLNNINYSHNCRITTNKGFIIEILYSPTDSSFLYRLLYENQKIKYILESSGTKEEFNDFNIFLDYITTELLKSD